jgi:hypothetical protein
VKARAWHRTDRQRGRRTDGRVVALLAAGGLAVVALAACARTPEPRTNRLAVDDDDAAAAAPAQRTHSNGRRTIAQRTEGDAAWIATDVLAHEWTFADGVWTAPVVLVDAGAASVGPTQRLEADGRAFEHVGPRHEIMGWTPRPGGFHADGDGLRLVLEDGERPPPRATLEVWAGRNRRENGRLRVRGARFHGEGFALLRSARSRSGWRCAHRRARRRAAAGRRYAEPGRASHGWRRAAWRSRDRGGRRPRRPSRARSP